MFDQIFVGSLKFTPKLYWKIVVWEFCFCCWDHGVVVVKEIFFGWGFPSFKGGTLQFANDYGLINFRNRSQELADKYGERFSPPKLLNQMSEKGETF